MAQRISRIMYPKFISFFLSDALTEPSERMVEFGMGGLCNLALGQYPPKKGNVGQRHSVEAAKTVDYFT